MRRTFTRTFTPYYEDDTNGDPKGDPNGDPKGDPNDDPNGDPDGDPDAAKDKTFTQDQVDLIIKKRLKREREERQTLLDQLEKFKKNKNLSDEERTNLQSQIDRLQDSLLTKEELANKQKKDLEKRYTQELDSTRQDAETWRQRYTTSTIRRAITDAAVGANAYRPSQIVALLEPMTRLDEVLDDENNSTGDYVPMVKFPGRDKDDKPVMLDLPVEDAIKEMADMHDEYGNLFKTGATAGVGANTSSGSGPQKVNYKDVKGYIEGRRSGKINL